MRLVRAAVGGAQEKLHVLFAARMRRIEFTIGSATPGPPGSHGPLSIRLDQAGVLASTCDRL